MWATILVKFTDRKFNAAIVKSSSLSQRSRFRSRIWWWITPSCLVLCHHFRDRKCWEVDFFSSKGDLIIISRLTEYNEEKPSYLHSIFPSIPRFHSKPQICFTYHNSLGRSLPIIILQSSVLPRRQCTTLSNRHRWSDFLFFLRKVHFEHGLFSLVGTVKFVQFTNCISQGSGEGRIFE